MPSFSRVVALALGAASYAQAFSIELQADVTRDGKIDQQDRDAKQASASGEPPRALFLANIADTNKRCARKWPIGSQALLTCNDASGLEVLNEDRLARFRLEPCTVSPEKGYGQILADNKNVRLFYREKNNNWRFIKGDTKFSPTDLKQGLDLAIDSRDVRREGWDGKVAVIMRVYDGETYAKDTLHFELAPVLIPHVLQPPLQLMTLAPPSGEKNRVQGAFVHELEVASRTAKMPRPVLKIGAEPDFYDRWTQDYVKPAYMSMPGPQGAVGLNIMMASPQKRWAAHDHVFWQLRDDNTGAVQPLGFGVDPKVFSTIDSYGNLDMIPPFVGNPNGKPIAGVFGNFKPLVLEFLNAQDTPAIEVDSGWLVVGHIDEFMQFLPHPDRNGEWILAVNDPMAGLRLLQDARNGGHGSGLAFSRPAPANIKRGLGDKDKGKGKSSAGPEKEEAKQNKGESWADMAEEEEAEKEEAKNNKGKSWADMAEEEEAEENQKAEKEKANKNKEKTWADVVKGVKEEKTITPPARDIHIDEMVGIPRIEEFAKFCDDSIRAAIDIIKQKTGLTDDRIIRIPVVYLPKRLNEQKMAQRFSSNTNAHTTKTTGQSSSQPTYDKYKDWLDITGIDQNPNDMTFRGWGAISAYPNAINGIVLPNGHYVAPKTWGPIIKGEDIFFKAVQKAYQQAKLKIIPIDDWCSHHTAEGDIHCGTNMIRKAW